MMPSMGMPGALTQGPTSAKLAMAALMSALTSSCECEACKILRQMGEDLKSDLLK